MSKTFYNVYTITNFERNGERRSKWFKIGAAFEHKDGEGFDVVLSAVPVNGRLAIRKPKAKDVPAAVANEDEDGVRAWIDDVLIFGGSQIT